jgi:SAM-dependent methyltransferase
MRIHDIGGDARQRNGRYTSAEIARISDNWRVSDWPEALGTGVDYARGSFVRDFAYYLDRVEALGVSGEAALDAGCGPGHWSVALAAQFDRVVGVDRTANRIDAARWYARKVGAERVSYLEADLSELTFAPQTFDFIYCYSVIISVVKLLPTLREFHRLLRPGGSFYIGLNGLAWSQYLRDEAGEKNANIRHQGVVGLYNTICNAALGGHAASFSNVRMRMLTEPDFIHALCGRGGGDAAAFATALSNIRKTAQSSVDAPALAIELARTLDPSVGTEFGALTVIHDFVAAAGEEVPLAKVAGDILKECGAKYLGRFLGDVACFLAGHNFVFSEFNAGRNYGIEEVKRAVDLCGFTNLRFASEGQLRGPGYSKELQPIYAAPPGGALRVWEFMGDKA